MLLSFSSASEMLLKTKRLSGGGSFHFLGGGAIFFQRLFLLAVAFLLSACSLLYTPYEVRDAAPEGSFDVSLIHPIEPRPERIGPAGNTSPYQVYGQTYHIMPSASGYREEGVASWYGTKFHGELTSNGERYDLYALSAAHKTLPIPSYVRVTNLNNGRQIVVRVNDRGPFHGDRIIDLSYAAALKLGYQQHGTARVSLEAITFDAETQGRNHYLQVGAFSLLGSAQGRQAHIESFTDYPVDILLGDDGVHRVQIGPLLWSELATLKSDLTQQDISVSVVSR